MPNVDYEQQKNNLKEKYSRIFFTAVDDFKVKFKQVMLNVLGQEYESFKREYLQIEEYVSKTKSEFFNSNEYVTVKNNVSNLKSKIQGVEGNEISEQEGLLHKELSRLSTLNTTLNNRLSKSRQQLDELKEKISSIFELNKDELNKLRKDFSKEISKEIGEILLGYNTELNAIKKQHGITDFKTEFPFDVEEVKIDSITDKFQSDYFSGNMQNANKTTKSVALDNLFDFKN